MLTHSPDKVSRLHEKRKIEKKKIKLELGKYMRDPRLDIPVLVSETWFRLNL